MIHSRAAATASFFGLVGAGLVALLLQPAPLDLSPQFLAGVGLAVLAALGLASAWFTVGILNGVARVREYGESQLDGESADYIPTGLSGLDRIALQLRTLARTSERDSRTSAAAYDALGSTPGDQEHTRGIVVTPIFPLPAVLPEIQSAQWTLSKELLELFVETTSRRLAMVTDALVAGDAATLSKLCQTTAEAASMVGAEGVAQVARLLADCEPTNEVAAAALLTQLRDEVRRVNRVAQPKKKRA